MVPHLCPSQPQAHLSDHRKAPYWTPSSENIQGNAHSLRQKGFYLRACGARALASGRSSLGAASARPGKHLAFTRQAEEPASPRMERQVGAVAPVRRFLGHTAPRCPVPLSHPPRGHSRWQTKLSQPSSKQGREREKGGQ